MTDEFARYNIIRREGQHVHLKVDHTKGMPTRGIVHTNNC